MLYANIQFNQLSIQKNFKQKFYREYKSIALKIAKHFRKSLLMHKQKHKTLHNKNICKI